MNSQDNPIFLSRLTKWDVFKATWLVFFLNLIYVPQKSRFTRFFIHIIYFLATIFFILSLNNANFLSKIICLLGIFSPLIMTIYAAFFWAQQYPTPTIISLFSLSNSDISILKNKYNISSKNINSAGILDLDTAIFINTKKMYIISSFKDSNLNNHHQKVIIKIISKSQNNTVLKKTKLFLTIKNRCKYYFKF